MSCKRTGRRPPEKVRVRLDSLAFGGDAVGRDAEGLVVFVVGTAGQGKTALMEDFVSRAQATHPDLVVAGGSGNAHTGIGDPCLRVVRHELSSVCRDANAGIPRSLHP